MMEKSSRTWLKIEENTVICIYRAVHMEETRPGSPQLAEVARFIETVFTHETFEAGWLTKTKTTWLTAINSII
jgi:hypothetical protein